MARFRGFLPPPDRLFLYGLVGLILFMGSYILFSPNRGLFQVLELKKEKARLEQEVERLEAETEELEQQINRLEQADPFVIESEARRTGMIREGEEVFRLKYEEVPDSGSVEPDKP